MAEMPRPPPPRFPVLKPTGEGTPCTPIYPAILELRTLSLVPSMSNLCFYCQKQEYVPYLRSSLAGPMKSCDFVI